MKTEPEHPIWVSNLTVVTWLRFVAAVVFVAGATLLGTVLRSNTTAASLVLLLAVVLAALLGRGPGAIAAVCGFLVLNWFFTAPRHTFAVDKRDDLFALVTFVGVALVVGTLMTRADVLRRRAADLELQARVRLEILGATGSDAGPQALVEQGARALTDLFALASCQLEVGGFTVEVDTAREPGRALALSAGDGRAEIGEGRGSPLTSADHAFIKALLVMLATSVERFRLEAEAGEARIAAAVGRTRSGFLSAVSHNLRTPLAAIKASVTTLTAPDVDLTSGARRELLDTIFEETDRLERLVAKVLDLSRIRAGGLEPERQPVDVADLARIAIRRLRPITRAHTIRVVAPTDLPPLWLDLVMAEQVFMNLLENALRFSPPGSEIRIEARHVDRNIEIRVIDHGPGIPDAEHERIFEEFVRGETRAEASGTGLGLAIVRSLVEVQGGAVWCENTLGGGATFVIRLPITPQ